ncbi:hypothetical protein EU527_07055 [Candidatus Thorarchaeota archaeon]|nr:MAG: hypothetical protein EU527_07055 [Candidatus Thorarchaeota archaeon]
MGLFDSWRRKREPAATVKLEKPAKPLPAVGDRPTSEVGGESQDIVNLVAEYERLVKRREELQIERGELTEQLDRGELDASEFRVQLMTRIQEASQVSENLRTVSSKLTALGYRGVLH